MRLSVLTVACAAALAAAPAYAQDSAAALRQDIQTLRQTLEQMEKRLQAIESGQPPPASPAITTATASGTSVTPAPLPAPLTAQAQVPGMGQAILPQRDSVADPSSAASRPDSAAGPTDPELKGFFAIPNTDTLIRIGGYAKLDAIADSRAAGDQEQFVTSSIPAGVHDAAGNRHAARHCNARDLRLRVVRWRSSRRTHRVRGYARTGSPHP